MNDRAWLILFVTGCADPAPSDAVDASSGDASTGASPTTASSGGSSGVATDDPGSSATTMGGSDESSEEGSTTSNPPPESCDDPAAPGLPADAPALEVGVWTDISPEGPPFGNDTFTQGLAIDPCNPAIIYVAVSAFEVAPAGLFKTTNAGATWTRVAHVETDQEGVDHIDEPIRVRIDPEDPLHLYVVDGVRGATMGFWESHDGGENFTMPQSFRDLEVNEDIFQWDLYDVAVDPTDFEHLLVSSHSPWSWEEPNIPAGVLESKDGGDTWIVHPGEPTWSQGHAINFLYVPELGIGDPDTWLLGTQGDGMWRTSDAGESWTKVTDTAIQHGGGTIYYSESGILYASGTPTLLRSTDNGESWMEVGPSANGFTAVHGDGELLYTAVIYGPAPFSVSPEDDGVTWTMQNEQQFEQGPFEMAFDPVNRILYSASWNDGVWALRVE
jgi:photosystem II stability/assembly factor-like uncharacterized protein